MLDTSGYVNLPNFNFKSKCCIYHALPCEIYVKYRRPNGFKPCDECGAIRLVLNFGCQRAEMQSGDSQKLSTSFYVSDLIV